MSKSTIRHATAVAADNSSPFDFSIRCLVVRASNDPSIPFYTDAQIAAKADSAMGDIASYFGGQGLLTPRRIVSLVYHSPGTIAVLDAAAAADAITYGQDASYMLWVRLMKEARNAGVIVPSRKQMLLMVYLGGNSLNGPGNAVGANDVFAYPSGRYTEDPSDVYWNCPGTTGIAGPRAYRFIGIDPTTVGVGASPDTEDVCIGAMVHESAHCFGNGEDHLLEDAPAGPGYSDSLMGTGFFNYPSVNLSATQKAILKHSPFLGGWTGLTNLAADDNSFAAISATQRSLRIKNFGFATGSDPIPTTAVIDSIIARLRVKANLNGSDGAGLDKFVEWSQVKLVKAGTVVGDNQADTDHWPTSEATFEYDGSAVSARWGTAWTPADVRDGDFGLDLIPRVYCEIFDSYIPTPSGFTAPVIGSLDFVELEVIWHTNPTAPSLVGPIGAGASLSPVFTGARNDLDDEPMVSVEIEVRRQADNSLMWASGVLAVSPAAATFAKSYAGLALAPGVSYIWRARTYDTRVVSPWSGYQAFTTGVGAPPTATLISPANGSIVGSLTPILRGGYVAGVPATGGSPLPFAAYQIQVQKLSDSSSFWDASFTADAGEVASAGFARNFAGSALAFGTAYRWRLRVYDGVQWSVYSNWATFTPQNAPDRPTGIAPSGLINTLTPTIQGVYHQAAGGTEDFFQYEIRRAASTIYQSGDVAADIATGQAYGSSNPSDVPDGAPALEWGTAYSIRVRSKDNAAVYSDWTDWQDFHTNAAPLSPTLLSPVNANTGDTTPRLRWQHNDPDDDAQTEVEIELRLVSDDSAVTGYDPITLAQATTSHDVTEVLTDDPATVYKWRARTKGTAGPGFGPWSNYETFTVSQAPSVVITSPADDDELTAPAFTVTWTYDGGNPQQDYRVQVFEGTTLVYDSGTIASAITFHDVPSGSLLNNKPYTINLTVHDTDDIEGVASAVAVTTNWLPPDLITGVTVTALGGDGVGLPGLYVNWDASVLGLDVWTSYAVYRRVVGEAEWIRIARIRDKSATSIADYTPAADVTYEYAVTQTKDDGEEIESEKQDPAPSGTLTFRFVYIHDAGSPEVFVALPAQSMNVDPYQDVVFLQPWGRQAPTAHVGEVEASVVRVTQVGAWDGDSGYWTKLMALITRQRTTGAILVARQRRGVRIFCTAVQPSRSDDLLFTASVELHQTYYQEDVD